MKTKALVIVALAVSLGGALLAFADESPPPPAVLVSTVTPTPGLPTPGLPPQAVLAVGHGPSTNSEPLVGETTPAPESPTPVVLEETPTVVATEPAATASPPATSTPITTPTAQPTLQPTQAPPTATATTPPTATVQPPTATAQPTSTPQPTNTPAPTATLSPFDLLDINPGGEAGTGFGLSVGFPDACKAGTSGATYGGAVGTGSNDRLQVGVCRGMNVDLVLWTQNSSDEVTFTIDGCGRTRSFSLSVKEPRIDTSFIC